MSAPRSEKLGGLLAELVRVEVARYLGELGVGAVDYTSDAPPSGISRRAFNTACRSGKIAGALKDGKTWRCSRAAWDEGRTRAPKHPALVERPRTDAERAKDFLKAAGVRSVGSWQ